MTEALLKASASTQKRASVSVSTLNAKPSVMARHAYTSRERLAACSMCHIQATDGHASETAASKEAQTVAASAAAADACALTTPG